MPAKPRLPDDFDLPTAVNGWIHDPDDRTNGHCWQYEQGERPLAIRVYETLGACYAAVTDERTSGMESKKRIIDLDHADREDLSHEEAIETGINATIEWMNNYGEGEWSHPRIHEAAFQPPVGYELASYRINSRTTTVLYHQTNAREIDRLAGGNFPDEMSANSCPYLKVETWAGSRNSTVALAPWKCAHDNEQQEIADPPEECGIEVALTTAREFARTSIDGDDPIPADPTGQTSLGRFASQG